MLLEKVDALNVWPEYILNDRINMEYWERIYYEFPLFQFFLMDGDVLVANGNCVPLYLTKSERQNLSDRGWDWALEKAFIDKDKQSKVNTLCALQIAVNKNYQGQGISKLLLRFMKAIAREQKLKDFILPIRPSMKHLYPLQRMEDYMQWINEKGQPYDSWIRTHLNNGAKIVKVCKESMFVDGTVKQWEEWTGYTFQSSGKYIIPFALNPIEISIETNRGVYIEPNVWMQYNLDD
ncbi:GNAT family N-acetyltransferase [Myroides albus]|uniref:GNAT family N-acetyltransferase n=1 Tax=Myroides albus TaxID=2562892 RepID=UPI0018ACAE9D|nr:GNAT family N-acetyltransferase [Myroides albus]UVD79924.1 GNAT family N-acetyltransferase [Myroides albus]